MMPTVFIPLLDVLKGWDVALFRSINNGTHNRFFDAVMPFVTNLNNWRIPIVIIWIGLIVFGGRKGRVAALLAVVCLAVSDQLSSNLLKERFARARPCHALDHVRLLIDCTKAYSFPSSHATNIFAQAALFSFIYRKLAPLLMAFACLIGYSRVYVGVHFPFDVLAGAVLGVACGGFVILAKHLFGSRVRPSGDGRIRIEGA